MAKPKFRYPAAIICWLDAHARNQAVEFEESEVIQQHRPEACQILGLVIKDDPAGVSLYCEETGPSSVRGLNFIPRAMIHSVTYVTLTPVRPRQRHSDTPRAEGPEVEP